MQRAILLLTAMAAALVVASGVALAVNKTGTNGPDTLWGTKKSDNLVGLGGNDDISGLSGSDSLLGGLGNDDVYGDRGSDTVVGGDGNDYLEDGPYTEFSEDRLSGGDGDDNFAIYNKPAVKDVAVCGGGFDVVYVDWKDEVAPDCERVHIVITQ